MRAARIAALLAVLACGPAAEPRAPLPWERIVLVSIDTLRADRLGAYGYPRDTSPFLDELARGGVLFERAYAPMATTAPSHASMFTSLYPVQHGVVKNGLVLDDRFPTLAELLATRGFTAAGFVSTNVHFASGGLDRGFAVFDEPAPGAYEKYRPAAATVDAALAWLADRPADERLFVLVHLFDPHAPWRPPTLHREALEPAGEDERRALLRFWIREQHVPLRFFRRGAEGLFRAQSLYDAEVRFADAELRRLHDGFARAGLAEGTLWILTSDHGEGLGNHQFMHHGRHLYDEQVRVPLVFHAVAPPLEPRRVAAIVEHVDLLPTLAELTGGPPPPDAALEGRSLAPLLRGEDDGAPADRAAFVQRRAFALPDRPSDQARGFRGFELGEKFALVERRWKYLHRSIGSDELYDLAADPYETRNLAGAKPEEAARMQARLRARRAELEAARGGEPSARAVDAETRAELEALGYAP